MTHVCLGDVAREIKQKVPVDQELPTVGLEHLDPGEVELAHWDEGVETTFTKAFSKGQVLFGRRRAYLRKAAVAPFDGICSGDITVIAPKDNLSRGCSRSSSERRPIRARRHQFGRLPLAKSQVAEPFAI